MPDDVSHYKCPVCGAPVSHVPGSSLMHCDYCGSDSPVSSFAESQDKKGYDWKDGEAAKVSASGGREYVCKSCGASIQSFDDTFTTSCPYCGNNVSVHEETEGGVRPNLIIPFELKEDEIRSRISDFLKGKKLLPSGFASAAKSGELKGVYVPFWLFDCSADGSVFLHAEKETSETRTVPAERRPSSSASSAHGPANQVGPSSQARQQTVTKILHYRLEREGHFDFSRLPVDASKHFDDDAMDALEPYDYGKIADFDPLYFAGCLAEKFTSTPDEETSRTYSKVKEGVFDYFKSKEIGYSSISIEKDDMKIETSDVKYTMLPVYALNFSFKGEKHQIYANGQTGRIAADLPVDAGKSWKYALLTFFPVFALAFMICLFI